MNRSQLIEKFAERNGLSNAASGRFVVAFFEEMTKALKEGEHVEFRGFGSFDLKRYEPYTGRNPKTGEKVEVPVRRRVRYRMSEQLLGALNTDMMRPSENQAESHPKAPSDGEQL